METLVMDLIKVIVEMIGGEIKEWIRVSLINRHWREGYLSLLTKENLPYLKTWVGKWDIPVLGSEKDLEKFFYHNTSEAVKLFTIATFHPIFSELFGFSQFLAELKEVKICSKYRYDNAFSLNDYALSMYTTLDHATNMDNFLSQKVEEKADFIITLYHYKEATSKLEGAVAHEVPGSAHIGYVYAYKKPSRSSRDLFIMPAKGTKKIYLNGLSSVYDSRRIKKKTKLFHIRSKQHGPADHKVGFGGGYSRGMEMINLLKPHLLKSKPILEKLMSWATR